MSNELLAGRYDAALLDLDGTIYEGGRAVPGALEGLTEAGLPMLFVTNNASRAPETVAEQLRSLGYDCDADDVMTSAQAAIEMAADIIPEGSKVLILGAQSFRDLATDAGYELVDSADDEPAAVFQGHNPGTNWEMMSEAALSISRGAKYLASNLDTTLPTERGLLVGNGSMVADRVGHRRRAAQRGQAAAADVPPWRRAPGFGAAHRHRRPPEHRHRRRQCGGLRHVDDRHRHLRAP